MPVFCVGLSHRTAPVELRERFAIPEAEMPGTLARLRAAGAADEAVGLSTCNRVEWYIASEGGGADLAQRFMIEAGGVLDGSASEALYFLREPASLEHLFRVASGLDSMVLGETEILGQLKRAYELARQHGHTGSRLNRAFQKAFNVAKQIRSETSIQRGGISVASVSVELAEHIFESLEGRKVLVLGAGDTGEKVARALTSRGAGQVLIHNRSPEKAQALADALGGKARPIAEWIPASAEVDVIVSSTSSPGFVLDEAMTRPLMEKRPNRPLLLVDLAVPRDIDPAVIGIPSVYLFNVDDLQAIADAHLRERQAEKERCEGIIREKARQLAEGFAAVRPAPPEPVSLTKLTS